MTPEQKQVHDFVQTKFVSQLEGRSPGFCMSVIATLVGTFAGNIQHSGLADGEAVVDEIADAARDSLANVQLRANN